MPEPAGANTFAACLRTVAPPEAGASAFDAILIVGPEHARVFADAGWDRGTCSPSCTTRLQIPGSETRPRCRRHGRRRAGVRCRDATLPSSAPGGMLLVHAGGGAGLFSAMIGGWANGATGSQPVTRRRSCD